MTRVWVSATVRAGLLAGLLAVFAAGCGQSADAGVYDEALAEKLVAQCANLQEGDLVLITGGVQDVKLLEDLAVHVRKLGAFPLVTLGSEGITRRYYDEVPEKYDSQAPQMNLELANLITAFIGVSIGSTPGLLADVPAERRAAVSQAMAPVLERLLERSVRQVSLGNGLYPTEELAELFGMSRRQLADIFWRGVNADYGELQSRGEAVKAALSAGKQLRITHANGTDLRVQIEGRPVFITDGIISDEEVEQGGAACQVWLPAGEVYFTPVPGTAEGTVAVDRQFYQGKEITGLKLTYSAGRLTSMTAESGLEPLKARYEAAGPGKDLFAYIDIGINPDVELAPGSRMVAWMPAGNITVGLGGNTWAGGDNDAEHSMPSFLPGCTLEVDGKVLVEKGVLQL